MRIKLKWILGESHPHPVGESLPPPHPAPLRRHIPFQCQSPRSGAGCSDPCWHGESTDLKQQRIVGIYRNTTQVTGECETSGKLVQVWVKYKYKWRTKSWIEPVQTGVLTLRLVPIGMWVIWGGEGGVCLPEIKGSSTVSWTNKSRESRVRLCLTVKKGMVCVA